MRSILMISVLMCLGLVAAGTGCRSTSESAAPEAASDTANTATATADTANAHYYEPPAPAPGSALVRATMTACVEGESGYRCTLQIERVEGYGAATPVINTSAPLNVRAHSSIVSQFERNGVFTLSGADSVIFTLSHADEPRVGTGRAEKWRVEAVSIPANKE